MMERLQILNDGERSWVHRAFIENCNNQYKKEVLNEMATLKEEAQEYEPPQTKNIADLESVGVDFELENREGKDNEGKVFKYKVIVMNGEDYRVPGKVLGDLKVILEKKPDLKTFSVTKKGEGLKTQYTIITD